MARDGACGARDRRGAAMADMTATSSPKGQARGSGEGGERAAGDGGDHARPAAPMGEAREAGDRGS